MLNLVSRIGARNAMPMANLGRNFSTKPMFSRAVSHPSGNFGGGLFRNSRVCRGVSHGTPMGHKVQQMIFSGIVLYGYSFGVYDLIYKQYFWWCYGIAEECLPFLLCPKEPADYDD